MTADSMNEWYQQILDVSKELGENSADMLLCVYIQCNI